MTVELKYLAWVTALTAFMWVPYILNMIMVRGLIDAVGYPENPAPLAPWAARMKKAHYNAGNRHADGDRFQDKADDLLGILFHFIHSFW